MDQQQLNYWIQKAKTGDNEAIAAIVREYHRRVHEMSKLYAPEGADVRTVETKAFSRALRHLTNINTVEEFEPFLYEYVKDEARKAVVQKPVEEVVQNLIPEDATMAIETPDLPSYHSSSTVHRSSSNEEIKVPKIPTFKSNEESENEIPAIPRRTVRYEDLQPQRKYERESYEEEEDEKSAVKPVVKRKTPKYVPPVDEEEEEDDYDDYDDYDDEPRGIPSWLLVILIIIAVIIALSLALFSFVPKVWNGIANALPLPLPLAQVEEVEETPSQPTVTPVITVEPTAEATADAESTAETETEGEATAETTIDGDSAPIATAEATPAANAKVGTVTIKVDNLNIRSLASTSGSKVGSTSNGQTYDVYETETSGGYTWYRIGEGQWIADQNGQWVTFSN